MPLRLFWRPETRVPLHHPASPALPGPHLRSLLDRIDIHLEVPAVEFREIASKEQAESSASVRERIEAVRKRQAERFAHSAKIRCNARMTSKMIRAHCQRSPGPEPALFDL